MPIYRQVVIYDCTLIIKAKSDNLSKLKFQVITFLFSIDMGIAIDIDTFRHICTDI